MTSVLIGSEQSQQQFPFMRLPSELRILVYTLALQNFVDEIEAAARPSATLGRALPNHGAPALLKIDRLRFEVSDAMRLPAQAHHRRHEAIRADIQRHFQAIPRLTNEQIAEYEIVLRRLHMVFELSFVIDHVYRYVSVEERMLSRAIDT